MLGYNLAVPVQGDITAATAADKEWLTLAFLTRSVNVAPPLEIKRYQVSDFIDNDRGDFRLVNEFVIRAVISGTAFAKDVEILGTPKANIGYTRFWLFGDIEIPYTVFATGSYVYKLTITPSNWGTVQVGPNIAEPADKNDVITGGLAQDTFITHRNAGRAGANLLPIERLFLALKAPPFANDLTFSVNAETGALELEDLPSWDLDCIWPTTFVYELDVETQTFRAIRIRGQQSSPYNCFLSHGTPWP